MSLKDTDRRLTDGVFTSLQVYYRVKDRKRLHAKALLLSRALKIFHEVLELHPTTKVRIANIKKRLTRGLYCSDGHVATIEDRIFFKDMLETMAHEMVHGEQFNTGKLKFEWKNRDWVAMWMGTEGELSKTYRSYLDQPWEKEAFERQQALAAYAYVKLIEQLDDMTELEKEVLQ